MHYLYYTDPETLRLVSYRFGDIEERQEVYERLHAAHPDVVIRQWSEPLPIK